MGIILYFLLLRYKNESFYELLIVKGYYYGKQYAKNNAKPMVLRKR